MNSRSENTVCFEAPHDRSPGSTVWGRLRRDRWAMLGLSSVFAFFLLAVGAPLLALDVPIYLKIDDERSFPLLSELFNRLFFESAVDIFFNLLLVASPAYLSIWGIVRFFGKSLIRSRRHLLFSLTALHLGLFALVTPQHFGGHRNPFYRTAAVTDYTRMIETLKGDGHSVQFLFPFFRHSINLSERGRTFRPPSRDHLLGTDQQGLDNLTQIIYGTRTSLTIGVVAVSIYVLIGVVLGALAGFYGGWVDGVISRFIEVMICFPTFFLILTLAAFVENRSIFHVMVIIGLTGWPQVARLVRAEFLKQKALEYARAACALGLSERRIIFRHLLPNALAPVLVTATFGVAAAILIESSLSFLGLGDQTAPSWGRMLNNARETPRVWLVLGPGFPIFLLVCVLNLVGEGLRDALDPKLRK